MTTTTQISRSGFGWMRQITNFYRVRRDQRILSRFDDHLLKDIGLHRSEIASAVRHGIPPRDLR